MLFSVVRVGKGLTTNGSKLNKMHTVNQCIWRQRECFDFFPAQEPIESSLDRSLTLLLCAGNSDVKPGDRLRCAKST